MVEKVGSFHAALKPCRMRFKAALSLRLKDYWRLTSNSCFLSPKNRTNMSGHCWIKHTNKKKSINNSYKHTSHPVSAASLLAVWYLTLRKVESAGSLVVTVGYLCVDWIEHLWSNNIPSTMHISCVFAAISQICFGESFSHTFGCHYIPWQIRFHFLHKLQLMFNSGPIHTF